MSRNASPDILKKIYDCALIERLALEYKYGTGVYLCGKGIEASNRIIKRLGEHGIDAKAVTGYCIYSDNIESCIAEPFEEHTWVNVYIAGSKLVCVDITGDQFNGYLCEYHKMPSVYTGSKPIFYRRGKPTANELRELGWSG